MITASHNPKEYNGFKIVGKNASPISEKTGLLEIKHIFDNLPQKENSLKAEYIKHITKDFNLKDFNFKIGIDTANSVSGILIDDLFKKQT